MSNTQYPRTYCASLHTTGTHCYTLHSPVRQSAYRRYHSTDTVVVSVLNDVIRAADEGKVTCLVLLDLSSAFDTVDHDILLQVLNRRFLVEGSTIDWFPVATPALRIHQVPARSCKFLPGPRY